MLIFLRRVELSGGVGELGVNNKKLSKEERKKVEYIFAEAKRDTEGLKKKALSVFNVAIVIILYIHCSLIRCGINKCTLVFKESYFVFNEKWEPQNTNINRHRSETALLHNHLLPDDGQKLSTYFAWTPTKFSIRSASMNCMRLFREMKECPLNRNRVACREGMRGRVIDTFYKNIWVKITKKNQVEIHKLSMTCKVNHAFTEICFFYWHFSPASFEIFGVVSNKQQKYILSKSFIEAVC